MEIGANSIKEIEAEALGGLVAIEIVSLLPSHSLTYSLIRRLFIVSKSHSNEKQPLSSATSLLVPELLLVVSRCHLS